MNNYNIILIIFVCILLYKIFQDSKIEEFGGNDFNHYSFMNDYATKIREEGLKKIFKFYGQDAEGNVLDHKKNKEAFKVEGKSELIKGEEEKEIVEVKDFVLEDKKLALNINKKDFFAKYLEVEEYNSGSGNLADLNKAFDDLDKKNYKEGLKFLYSRGGNVHVKKE
jgi:hypothetical protein